MNVDFELPQRWLNPKNKDHVLLVAQKFQELRYGAGPHREVPWIRKDGSVEFPITNDFWLFPPGTNFDSPKNHWTLAMRYDGRQKIAPYIKSLQNWSPEKPADL